VFCQWCATERDDNSIAIHHCGPTDRPPVYCMQCGQPLEGAPACAACGTPAGERPAAAAQVRSSAAAAARLAPGAAAAAVHVATVPTVAAPESSAADGGGVGPAIGSSPNPAQRGSPVPAPAARAVAHDAGGVRALCRTGAFWSALVGTLAFFVSWGAFPVQSGPAVVVLNVVGIQDVELAKFHWWNPPSAQLLFIGFLVALVISVVGYRSATRVGDVIVAVLGVCLAVLVGDVLYELRSYLSDVTALWLVVGAAAAMTGFATAAAVGGGD
jgi:hypothetical protein